MKLVIGLMLLPLMLSAQRKINVACIGSTYPMQLQGLLGEHYIINDFGLAGATVLHKGDKPYSKQPVYQKALASNPDVVFIALGAEDSKLVNRVYLNDFEADYRELIRTFKMLRTHPRIIMLTPVAAFATDSTGIWEKVINEQIIPNIQHVAYTEQLEVINLHMLFMDKAAFLPDKIHPNADGADLIARRLYALLKQKQDAAFDLFNRIEQPYKMNSFYGYNGIDFIYNGRSCKIVKPKWSAPHHPWVWRARFWGHEPQTDIALLEHGFHIVYCDVVELYGNDLAVSTWNGFYQLLRNAGLAPKAVLEGMSRGGVYMYNWAAVNQDKVACIYGDNPVLDLKSWPAGMGRGPGSKKDLAFLKEDYSIATDEQMLHFHNSPLDKVAQIAKGHYAILHLLADADEVVPPEENTLPFARQIEALGGDIQVIHKPGFKHHPHSFPNPTIIVDFILSHVAL